MPVYSYYLISFVTGNKIDGTSEITSKQAV